MVTMVDRTCFNEIFQSIELYPNNPDFIITRATIKQWLDTIRQIILQYNIKWPVWVHGASTWSHSFEWNSKYVRRHQTAPLDFLVYNTSYSPHIMTWWRHQMETFSALLAICAGNSPVPGEFPAQRPVTRSLDVFFDLRLNKRLSKQSRGWWFETLPRPLWRHSSEFMLYNPLSVMNFGFVNMARKLTDVSFDVRWIKFATHS